MNSSATIIASDSVEEMSLLNASLDIISNAKESEVRDSPSSPYVLETGFEEEPLSPTTSSDYEDDFEDDSHEEGVLTHSSHKYRGKSLKWIDHLEDIDGDFAM